MTNVVRLYCRASNLKTELERALYYSQFLVRPTVSDADLQEVHALLDHVTGRTQPIYYPTGKDENECLTGER